MTLEDSIKYMRGSPEYDELVRDSYLGADVREAAERFRVSAEFAETLGLIGDRLHNGKALDLGAGNGIASYAFVTSGARLVYALEPNPSPEIGRGAIQRLGLPGLIEVLDAYGEQIPLDDDAVDVVYARQVLHHTRDLELVLRECARVLRKGGIFIACREHVVDDEHQLKAFLRHHPVHQLAGGENAFRLDVYLTAISKSGLQTVGVLGPFDTVINAFPRVRTVEELTALPVTVLERHFGILGRWASVLPGVRPALWRRLNRPIPGRMYSFIATK